jgi:hypothetical protein
MHLTIFINNMMQQGSMKKLCGRNFLHEENLLCQFDLFLHDETRWNPNPMVGDVQIKLFSSFIRNQIKWKEEMSFYGQNEIASNLMFQSEHPIATIII